VALASEEPNQRMKTYCGETDCTTVAIPLNFKRTTCSMAVSRDTNNLSFSAIRLTSKIMSGVSIHMLSSLKNSLRPLKCFHDSSAPRTVMYSFCLSIYPQIYLYPTHPHKTNPPYLPIHENLHVLAHHSYHEIEQANSLNKSETQNGV
jgi:hypothetical protein